MSWKICSRMGERIRFAKLALQARWTFAELCGRFGISRTVGYKWKKRFIQWGQKGLKDRSRRPHRSPNRISRRWVKWIRRLRQQHRTWGARKILGWLTRAYPRLDLPSERTIASYLKTMKLTKGQRRRRRGPWIKRPPLTQAKGTNQVWTVDFKGWFRTGNGQRIEPLTVRDLYSRYGLEVRLLESQRWKPVQTTMRRLFRRYGLPEAIRVDNGMPFGSTGPAGLSRLSVWWTSLGIRVEFIDPGHPEQNGAHEQFHRVLKRETTRPPAMTMRAQQRRSNKWRREYNIERPHEGLKQRTPASLYRRSPRRYSPKPMEYPDQWPIRQVRTKGEIKWKGRKRFLGEAFVGMRVGFQQLSAESHRVYFGRVLLGEMHDQDEGGLRPTALARRRARPQ